jgi:hypothetical protein
LAKKVLLANCIELPDQLLFEVRHSRRHQSTLTSRAQCGCPTETTGRKCFACRRGTQ